VTGEKLYRQACPELVEGNAKATMEEKKPRPGGCQSAKKSRVGNTKPKGLVTASPLLEGREGTAPIDPLEAMHPAAHNAAL
jgi:hypothetical protein